jgi:DNA-binding transcriptional regulator LsrR (DeoR family)
MEAALAVRAAWLSYVGGYRQEDIAERLNVSRVKVNRLIAQAHRRGMIRVFVEGTAADCVALEDAIAQRFGLRFVNVAPSVDDSELPLLTLGTAGARYLHRILEEGRHPVIGVGQGRTLAAVVDCLPRLPRPNVRFVSLLGCLIRNAVANPYDIIHRLAERTGGECYFLPAPFFADSRRDRDLLIAQRSLKEVFDLAREASLSIIGIGEVADNAYLRMTRMVAEKDTRELEAAGAAGEVLGQFLDRDGKPVDVGLNHRSLGLKLEDLRGREVVVVAGGRRKVAAIEAVLRTGVITGLIVDEATAKGLVEQSEAG